MKRNGNGTFNEKAIKTRREKLEELRKEEQQITKKIQHDEKLF